MLSYTLFTQNYRSDNLIPSYIKGDGQKVYIFRLNGTKLANIYPNGTIEVNSIVPAIAKTLMSQTKNYKYSFRETLLKSYVPERVKLSTDLHTHGNANIRFERIVPKAF